MAQFILSYLGGNPPSTPEEGKAHFERYKIWLLGLGESVVSPANPFKNTHTIAPDGSVTSKSTTSMSGFTIIESESIEKALEVAQSCPFLDIGGTLEVSELMQMSM